MSTPNRRKPTTSETESGPTPKPKAKAKRARMESGSKEAKAKKAANGVEYGVGHCLTILTLEERVKDINAWRTTFLAVLSRTGNVAKACARAGVSRQVAYLHRREDKAFRLAWRKALRAAVDYLESQAWRIACDGYNETTVERGPTGVVLKTTTKHRRDTAVMMKFLAAHLPEKYRDRSSVELTAVAAPQVDPALQRAMLADPEVCRLQSELDARLSLLRQQVASVPALPGPTVVEVEGSHGEKGTDGQ